VFFAADAPRDYAAAAACDAEAYGAWCRALLARGVYAPPSQFEAWFPSLAHDGEHIARTVEAAAAAFAEVGESAGADSLASSLREHRGRGVSDEP
jgi:glutamate-1-semialdehyde 2,1-aminomutase